MVHNNNDDDDGVVLLHEGTGAPPYAKWLPLFYFALGIQLQLPQLAASLYLLNDLQMDIASLAAYEATLTLPWCMKPFFGLVSDSFPICGRRRAPYIVLGNAVLALTWTALARSTSPTTAQALLFVSSVATCTVDVMYDSLLVEAAKCEGSDDHGTSQSLCWGARACGALIASLLGGLLLQVVTNRTIFALSACVAVGIGVFGGGLLCDQRGGERRIQTALTATTTTTTTCGQRVCTIIQAFRNPSLWRPAVFVFLFAATPSSGEAMFAFLVRDLHFTPDTLGILGFIRHAAMLFGTGLFQRCWRFTPYRRFFAVVVVVSAILGATPVVLITHWNQRLHIPNVVFAAGDDLFLSVLGSIALMPCLILVAKLVPPGVEASLYAAFVSLLNFGGLVSGYGGALMTKAFGVTRDDFTHLVPLVLTCTATSLLALCALPLLPRGNVRDVAQRE